ncbi:unnamed protein product [marine sediment metagenome]|uniref:Uncharacterized protein n=1 Tax=marine sediment metagenome TaxID=412755 RepID=X1QKD3_9ZZZZ
MAWVSPTSHDDWDDRWDDETNAYDEDTGSFAYYFGGAYYLELIHSAIDCDKVRIWALDHELESDVDPDILIFLYYDDGWQALFSGTITKNTWVEKAIGAVGRLNLTVISPVPSLT